IVMVEHDLLLIDAADEVFVDLHLQYKDDWITSYTLQMYRGLLEHCRQFGIDQAFVGLITPDITQELVDLVIEYADANAREAKRLVEDRKEDLLSDAAFQVMQNLIQKYSNDTELRPRLEARFMLLKHCQREGIDVAFADQTVTASEDIIRAIEAYIESYFNE